MSAGTQEMAAGAAGGAATSGTGRVGNVDVLRAVAALAIVMGHAYILGGRKLSVRAEYWYDVPLLQTATGVWLFFGISGYVISRPFVDRLLTGRPLPELVPYALRRTFRIFPLYWIALAIVIAVAGAAATEAWHYPVHFALLHNLVPGREGAIFSVAWTLTLEVLFYIAVPLLALALRRRGGMTAERVAGLVLVSWAASIAFTFVGGLQEQDREGLWLRGSFPAMWQMFCPGILLAVAPHLRRPAWRRWLLDLPATRAAVLAAIALFPIAALCGARAPLRYGPEVYQVITDLSRPMFAVIYGVVIARAIRGGPWFQRRGRFMLQLGLASYGIYLISAVLLYFFVFNARGRELVPVARDGLGPYVVHVAFLLALTIPLAIASWRWLERPCIRLGGALAQRWQERPLGDGGSRLARWRP